MQRTVQLLLLAATSAVALAAPAGGAGFQSPSKNIACVLFDGRDTGAFVRCDIEHRDWALPPKPSSAGCRELDFEGDLEVTAKGKGHFICAGDTILRQGPILGYGHSRSAGRFTCTMHAAGVTCTNRRTHHGFFVSRQSYRRF